MPQALDAKAPQLLALDAVVLATSEETLSHLIEMVWGDTRPTLEFTVKDANGVAISITGSTPRFRIRRRSQTAVLVNRICTITDGPGGKCQFAWATADWGPTVIPQPPAGSTELYDGELEVTFSDATIASVFDLYFIPVRSAVG